MEEVNSLDRSIPDKGVKTQRVSLNGEGNGVNETQKHKMEKDNSLDGSIPSECDKTQRVSLNGKGNGVDRTQKQKKQNLPL